MINLSIYKSAQCSFVPDANHFMEFSKMPLTNKYNCKDGIYDVPCISIYDLHWKKYDKCGGHQYHKNCGFCDWSFGNAHMFINMQPIWNHRMATIRTQNNVKIYISLCEYCKTNEFARFERIRRWRLFALFCIKQMDIIHDIQTEIMQKILTTI